MLIRAPYFFVFLALIFHSFHSFSNPLTFPPSDFSSIDFSQASLGQLLFYDSVLSGTYRVSCGSCHDHDRASSNGFRLDGGSVRSKDTRAISDLPLYDVLKPSLRHSPVLFNLGDSQFTTLFTDGRLRLDASGKIVSPSLLPSGIDTLLSAQALFPAITIDELTGEVGSDLTSFLHDGNEAVWNEVALRIRRLPSYFPYFKRAFPYLESSDDITITEIAIAISSFVASEWRSDNSAFDHHLSGTSGSLTQSQHRGMELFYGRANCSMCHSGRYQTDHKFHIFSMPPYRFGSDNLPSGFDSRLGRYDVTGLASDKYSFRTPTLRNITMTAPYGHSGYFANLEDALNYHLSPHRELSRLFPNELSLLSRRMKEYESLYSPKVPLSELEFADLLSFLESLLDEGSLSGRLGKPVSVPSSLVIE